MKGFYLSKQNYKTGCYDVDTCTMGLDYVTYGQKWRTSSGVRAHVFLKIQCTIQISGSDWQTQNGCLFLLV